MSWVRKTGLALSAILIAVPGIAEAGIIVGSSGPSASQFPVGKTIADNATITLRDGDRVTVMVKGSTRELRGAGTFSVGTIGESGRVKAFAALVRPRGASRVRPGAVRGLGGDGGQRSPNLWYLGTDQSGPFCIIDPNTIRLWRPDIETSASYRITARDGSGMTVDFPEDEMLAAWNSAAMPVADGSSFTIEGAGAARTTVTFAVLAEQPDNPESTAAALIDRGCSTQLRLLTDTLAEHDDMLGG